jgi:hypothetical protein
MVADLLSGEIDGGTHSENENNHWSEVTKFEKV